MTRLWLLLLAGGVALAGCADDGPSGPNQPALNFDIQAPREIESKAMVELLVTITTAERVEFPLRVELAKANLGEEFFVEGARQLNVGEQVASFLSVPGRDPRFRVTVTEAGERALSVSKTVFVDVIDFP